jgi:hypothetical protein
VGGQLLVIRAEATEVDDALHAGVAGSVSEISGCDLVTILEASLARGHGMNEVVGDVDPRERFVEAGTIEDVALSDLDYTPLPALEPARMAGETYHVVSGRDESRNQTATDVAGGASDENSHSINSAAFFGGQRCQSRLTRTR